MVKFDAKGTFTPDPSGLADQVQFILSRRTASITRQIAAQAKMNVPVKTGNLGRSIQEDPIKATGPFSVSGGVTANTNYAASVHDGTRPHVIRPKAGKKALKFNVGGRTVFAKKVNHPGTRPRPFLKNAAETVIRRLQ
ncbi:gp25 [Rhodococcus phage ReqiPine5]|uniref:Gp25 n=1 Tax=Rhodococcus phage ReqiPine5 TaxID=691963 RepID=D4P800_9CAUD|nr:gp25 [Rhodococcus phage ReqiPine5]ADD81130.1 gp25 [Rhodococcus phage ReqiPine5]